MFEILLSEYEESKSFVIDRMAKKYKDFNALYYGELLYDPLYHESKDIRFKELEKVIIEQFKQKKYEELITNFDGDCDKFYEELTKVNEVNYNESEYLTADEMVDVLAKKNSKIELGYPSLDYSLNLSQNDLLIIGAGTGVGKTVFALNLLVKLSKKYQCIYFNMEMSKSIIYKRILSNMTGIEMKKLNNIKELEENEKRVLHHQMKELETRKLILVNKSLEIKEIVKDIANIKTDKHVVVFIDHIGLIEAKGKSRYEVMTEVAKELRKICMNCECTVIGLCQLNRTAQKDEEAPKLQDLRDSGEIEQSARKVLLLHNVSARKEDRIQDIDVIIAKNDDGDKLIKNFRFDKYTQLFTEAYTKTR